MIHFKLFNIDQNVLKFLEKNLPFLLCLQVWHFNEFLFSMDKDPFHFCFSQKSVLSFLFRQTLQYWFNFLHFDLIFSNLIQLVFWNFLISITFMASLIFWKTFGILFDHFYFHCDPEIFLYEHGLFGALVTIFQFYSVLIWFFQKFHGHFYFYCMPDNCLYELFLIETVVHNLFQFIQLRSDFFKIFLAIFTFMLSLTTSFSNDFFDLSSSSNLFHFDSFWSDFFWFFRNFFQPNLLLWQAWQLLL